MRRNKPRVLTTKEENQLQFKRWLEKARVEDLKSDKSNKVFLLILAITIIILQCSINILACVLYIIDGYVEDPDTRYVLRIVDLLIAIFFTFEMMANFYFQTKPKYRYFLYVDTWIDAATVFPEYLSWIFSSSGGFDVSFLRILRVFKVIRILKFQKTLKKLKVNSSRQAPVDTTIPSDNMSRLKKQLVMLVVSLFATFFIAAGIVLFVQEIQPDAFNQNLVFDGSIYFVTITVGSLGYGDILPITPLSRMVTLVILLSVFTVFGNQISKIVAIMKESDEFDVQYSLRDHAIVFSANSIDLVCSFLIDYYKNNPHTKVLVIGEREMGQTMKSVLDLSYVEGKLYFLSMGKGFDRKTIKKS